MSTATGIEWTEVTWNPTTGCDRISPGCDHCYALTLAKRLKAMGQAKYQRDGDPRTSGPGFGVTVHEDALGDPLRWRKPRKVFVNSMSDIGHARVPAPFVARVLAVMAMCPQHQFQVLTKRPGRLASMLGRAEFQTELVRPAVKALMRDRPDLVAHLERTGCDPFAWPMPNVYGACWFALTPAARGARRRRDACAAGRLLDLHRQLAADIPVPEIEVTQ